MFSFKYAEEKTLGGLFFDLLRFKYQIFSDFKDQKIGGMVLIKKFISKTDYKLIMIIIPRFLSLLILSLLD